MMDTTLTCGKKDYSHITQISSLLWPLLTHPIRSIGFIPKTREIGATKVDSTIQTINYSQNNSIINKEDGDTMDLTEEAGKLAKLLDKHS